jgi:hypothetical protein
MFHIKAVAGGAARAYTAGRVAHVHRSTAKRGTGGSTHRGSQGRCKEGGREAEGRGTNRQGHRQRAKDAGTQGAQTQN